VAADSDAYGLAEMRFRAGVDSYLNTLDAQRSLYAAQQELVTLRQVELANEVTLYKALGGGGNNTLRPPSDGGAGNPGSRKCAPISAGSERHSAAPRIPPMLLADPPEGD